MDLCNCIGEYSISSITNRLDVANNGKQIICKVFNLVLSYLLYVIDPDTSLSVDHSACMEVAHIQWLFSAACVRDLQVQRALQGELLNTYASLQQQYGELEVGILACCSDVCDLRKIVIA